jgi:hypothetical protein
VIRGYEDMRLFWTEAGGLQGIAASTHLKRKTKFSVHPEQVIVSFRTDGSEQSDPNAYDIVKVHPIRGEKWDRPQKNWAPFDRATEPRFLYSIERGIVASADGPMVDDDAQLAEPAGAGRPVRHDLRQHPLTRARAPGSITSQPSGIITGGRPPARMSMPPSATEARIVASVTRSEARVVGGGQRYSGLRGGTQLVYIGMTAGSYGDRVDTWLGLGHEMVLRGGKKFYWHRFYTVDSNGMMLARSGPMKLAPEGIEFAAGMAIDGDRVVISFGVDDAMCRLGETTLEDIMWCLEEVNPEDRLTPPPRKPTPPRRVNFATSTGGQTQQGRPTLRSE